MCFCFVVNFPNVYSDVYFLFFYFCFCIFLFIVFIFLFIIFLVVVCGFSFFGVVFCCSFVGVLLLFFLFCFCFVFLLTNVRICFPGRPI